MAQHDGCFIPVANFVSLWSLCRIANIQKHSQEWCSDMTLHWSVITCQRAKPLGSQWVILIIRPVALRRVGTEKFKSSPVYWAGVLADN